MKPYVQSEHINMFKDNIVSRYRNNICSYNLGVAPSMVFIVSQLHTDI
jgi:hypothetical protein